MGTLWILYLRLVEGVSASCAKRAALEMSLASPGSTSSPLFLEDTRQVDCAMVLNSSLLSDTSEVLTSRAADPRH